MQEITIQELKEKALSLQKQGKKWHFHMLSPKCAFNKNKDKYAFILENETGNEVFVVYSDERQMEEGQFLVKILHGEEILEEKSESETEEDEKLRIILEKAKKLNEGKIPWHHHMFFPDCIFNKHKGKWCIVFEDPEDDKIIELISEEEPKGALRKIEVLYYKQEK